MPTTDQFSYNAIVTSMCGMASVCLVVYDQIATLPDEVEYIWRRKFSSVKLLFLMNRLALLLWASAQGYINYGAYVTFSLVWWGGQETLVWSMGCTIMQNLGLASQVLMIIIQAAFIAIRAYALTGGRWIISIAVSILGISPISNYIISTPFIKNVMPADRILGSAAPICSSSPLKPLESSGRNSVGERSTASSMCMTG
ncbi:hypothetical protein CERSUDRAFT_119683 [Gelatoporia subvermispora B]|uniref:DUF6533 domain-containing protein n=1 Tax=Ceriporiopsis subvermispora (strain B) TaxID=914234 RepID=M2Q3W2_CERS8|nr:hypothetical protein CERSUDRAFT_119683 [Gelatoporia subvermispora B]